jgi:serine protease Do
MAFAFLVIGGLVGAFWKTSLLQGQAPAPASTPYPKEFASYRDVVKVVLPAVVSIQSEAKVVRQNRQTPRRRPQIETVPGLPEEFRRFFEEQQQPFEFQMPDNAPRQSFGSGFVIDPKGIILTNFHVVAGATKVNVELQDHTQYTSTDIKGDKKNDLAIIRIQPKSPLHYLEFGDSDAMEIGDRVLAVGAPFRLAGSVTTGIVSAKGRSLGRARSVFEDYLQTDAAINPGNSGGPLVNLEGKVIGINTAIRTGTGEWAGVGLAITSNIAKSVAQQLIEGGVVHRGYLGVAIADKSQMKPEVAARLGLEKGGVVVSKVSEGSPAEKAGIRQGDIITSVAGKPAHDSRELQRIVGGLPLNKPADIGIIRDGREMTVQASIQEQPATYGDTELAQGNEQSPNAPEDEGLNVEKVGITIADMTPDLASRLGYKKEAKGVVIIDVQQGSIAETAGVQKGWLITRIDKKPVAGAAEAKQMLQKPEPEGALVQFQTPQGGTVYEVLKLETAEK